MPKIKFEYNLNKDAYIYSSLILFSVSFGIKKNKNLELIPKNIQKEVKKIYLNNSISHSKLLTVSKHPVFQPIIAYLKEKSSKSEVLKRKKILEKEWSKVGKKYFEKLSKTLNKPIYKTNYKCYLTSLFYCPCYYEGGWFMVSAFSNIENQIYVVCHEFMHLQFIHWYKDYCLEKGLTTKEFNDLKEAITFILNEKEFEGTISFQDSGYLTHQKIRKYLKTVWRQEKNFPKFLEKSIDYIKKQR